MTINVLFYTYYYKYTQSRKTVKDLVIADDITTAKTLLTQYVAEHDNYVTTNNIPVTKSTFTGIDNMALHHANEHIEAATTDINQKQATINALNVIEV